MLKYGEEIMKYLLRMRLRLMLPLVVVVVALLSTMIAGVINYQLAKNSLLEETESKLKALAEARSNALSDYLSMIENDLIIQAQNPALPGILAGYTEGWNALAGDQTAKLQSLYIGKNSYPLGEKDKLFDAKDGSAYSAHHNRFHEFYRDLQQKRSYYDIFLFDMEGNLVYSVFKENDLSLIHI